MGTIGLNFGSATSGTGFDVGATVTSILAVETAVETPWKSQIASLQAKNTALSTLGTNLSALSSAVGALTNFDGVLAAKQGSSSNSNVLSLTSAGSSAVAGSHTVEVTSLAQTSSKFSDRVTASDTLSGSLTLQIGGKTAQTFTLGSSSNTLATLAQALNSGSYGVVASVVSDTQGSRLSIVSATSGAAGQITVSSALNDATTSSSIGFSTGQTGADAQLTVDGLATTSASNTVTTAIPGVTFQLLSSAPGSSLQVQITNDNSAVLSAVQSLVTSYNSVLSSIKTQEGNDSSGKAQPLFGDPTLALVQTQLSAALTGGGASGAVNSITQLGVTVQPDGTLALDTNALGAALNAGYSDVTGFFQNAGSFGQELSATLNLLGSTSTTGAVSIATQENTTQVTGLNANIASLEARAATDKIRLTTELNTANQILQSIPQQLNSVNEIYAAITGYTGK